MKFYLYPAFYFIITVKTKNRFKYILNSYSYAGVVSTQHPECGDTKEASALNTRHPWPDLVSGPPTGSQLQGAMPIHIKSTGFVFTAVSFVMYPVVT